MSCGDYSDFMGFFKTFSLEIRLFGFCAVGAVYAKTLSVLQSFRIATPQATPFMASFMVLSL